MIEEFVLKNTRTGAEASFGKTEKHAYLIADDGVSLGAPSITHNSIVYPESTGEVFTSTLIGRREVSIIGWAVYELSEQERKLSSEEKQLLMEKKLQEKKLTLSKMFSPRDPLQLIFSEYYLEGKPSSPVQFSTVWAENNNIFCKFMLNMTCADPMFLRRDKTYAEAATVEGLVLPFAFPEDVGMSFVNESLSAVVINNIGEVSTGLEIDFTILGDIPIYGLKVTDIVTEEFFCLEGEFLPQTKIHVNTERGRNRKVLGGEGIAYENYYTYTVPGSTWLQAEVGGSVYRIESQKGGENYRDIDSSVKCSIALTARRYNIKEV